MPSSSADSYDPIEQSLQTSLNGPSTSRNEGTVNTFEENLLATSKKVLLSKIEFEPAVKNYSCSLKNLKNKYIHLNPDRKNSKNNDSIEMNGNGFNHNSAPEDDGIPTPKVMIYPPHKVKLGWLRVYRIGAGLTNMGNTCFINAILQCLTYTPPLFNHLIEFDEHSTNCKMVGFCIMCELFRHIRRALREKNGETIKPNYILNKLKAIAKHMVHNRQEDAHEFLRYIMESMIKSSLKGYNSSSLDRVSLETTVVNHIFGGYHRSQVICLKCKSKSDTYDHFMDLILDIKTVHSLEKAMEKYIQPDILDNDNAYMCPRCMKKCPAQKRFTIHRAPNIATFQLKRFDYNRVIGGKINKNISFPEKLDLRPYMSQTQGPPVIYQLYAVLVHQGPSCTSGHYFCFVRNSNNLWYCMDDCRIRQVSLHYVLSQQAYLLFYTRIVNDPTCYSKSTVQPCSNGQTTQNSVMLNGSYETHNKLINNNNNNLKQNATCTATVNGNGNVSNNNSNNRFTKMQTLNNPLATNREKVSFGIKTNNEMDSKQPRIVMHIKNGKVTSTCERKEKENENKTSDVNCINLVPYGPDSSEESDQEINKKVEGENSKKCEEESMIKATSSWVVVTNGNEPSSSSSPVPSEGSVKSTLVGWTVTNLDKKEMKGDRTYPGWTVTEKEMTNGNSRRYYDDDSQLLRHRRNSLSNQQADDNRRHSDTETQIARGKVYYQSENVLVKREFVGNNSVVNNLLENGDAMSCESKMKVNGHENCSVDAAIGGDADNGKKHRKRRRQKSDDEDTSHERNKRRRKKNNKRYDDGDHSSDDSEESFELEWVERTKETMEQERKQNSVIAKHWDENIKDGGYCRSHSNNNAIIPNGKDRCDERTMRHSMNNNSNNNSAVLDYFKNTQHQAYGAKVNSWNGGQSSLDREFNSAPRKWQQDDDYDDDYDKGRVKKTKMYNKRNRNEMNRFNPFQGYQNDRNYYSSSYNKQDRPPFHSSSRKPYFHHNYNHRNYTNPNFKYQNNNNYKYRGKKQNGGV